MANDMKPQVKFVEISVKIIDAFKFLGANQHIAECYAFLLTNSGCTLNQVRAQFHRKMKDLEFLLEKGWVNEEKDKDGLIYKPIPPEALLGNIIGKLAKEHKKLDEELNTLRTARAELKVMYDKGISNYVLNTPAEFYGWQKEMCLNAKKTILAATDRWQLALIPKEELSTAARRGVEVRVLGRIRDPNPDLCKELQRRMQELIEIGAQVRIIKENIRIRFMAIDDESIFFAIRKANEKHKGVWIKSPDFVKSFVEEFNCIWQISDEPDENVCVV